ncbi:putative class III chitinase [Xylariaceae sp. FL0594]|nr:putative class III chitinase [Xylariaceae sp. FL0594]
MAPSLSKIAVAGALALAPSALAGFKPDGQDNISVYWGQNGANGADTQGRLREYCGDNGIDIINVSFLISIKNPATNFASAGNACTAIDGTQLLRCPEIEEDIAYCQSQGKTILLSLGGATYSEGGFDSASQASDAAQKVWDLFGTNTAASADRPFGQSVVDGFDFDFESTTQNMVPFANKLRDLMDNSGASKKFLLSAAPQCVYPDAAMHEMLDGAVSFDFLQVQFYNNWCGVINFSNPNAWNFNVWDQWARTTSKNPAVKVLIGVPASPRAGAGYVDGAGLKPIVQDTRNKYPASFGGIMTWDMSTLYQNQGMLDGIRAALAGARASAARFIRRRAFRA